MRAIFNWLMNPENNPIMFAVAILIVAVCIGLSLLQVQ